MKVKRSLRTLVSNIAPTITSMDGTSTEHDEKSTTDNEIKYNTVMAFLHILTAIIAIGMPLCFVHLK